VIIIGTLPIAVLGLAFKVGTRLAKIMSMCYAPSGHPL
jgi:hypothetical protein